MSLRNDCCASKFEVWKQLASHLGSETEDQRSLAAVAIIRKVLNYRLQIHHRQDADERVEFQSSLNSPWRCRMWLELRTEVIAHISPKGNACVCTLISLPLQMRRNCAQLCSADSFDRVVWSKSLAFATTELRFKV